MNFARLLVQQELPNGLRSCVLPLSKNVVELRCLVHTGSIHEGPDLGRGISHMVEHMVFRGSKGYPGNAASDAFSEMGGCSLNAVTSSEFTMYQVAIPPEHLQKALHVICAMVRYPDFDAQAFAAEREVILHEADRCMDRPETRLYWKNSALFFPTHPLRHPVIGYDELIRSTTAEHLRAYHARRYAPNRCCWVAVGPVDPERFFSLIGELFGDWSRNMEEAPAFPADPVPSSPQRGEFFFPDAVERVTVCARQGAAVAADPGYISLIAGLIANLLNRELVQKRQLAHQIAPVYGGIREAAFQGVCGVTAPDKMNQLERAIVRQLSDFSEGKFATADFLREKKVIRSLCMEQLEQSSSLAQAIAMAMLNSDDGATAFDDPYSRIDCDTFRAAVKGMFLPQKLVICRQHSKKARSGSTVSQTTPPKPKEWSLPSGEKVLLLPRADRELCTLQLSWQAGATTDPANQRGLNTLTAEVLTCSTKRLTEDAVDKKMDHFGAGLEVRSSMTRTDLELTAPRAVFGKVLELLHEILTEPAFAGPIVAREAQILQEKIRTRRMQPIGAGMYAAFQTFYGDQPQGRSRLGEAEEIAALTPEDLRENYFRWWHKGTFRAGFAGAVSEEDAEKWLTALLKDVPWQPEPLALPPRAVPPEAPRTATVRVDREQALSMVMLPGVLLPGSPDHGAWKILHAAENGLASALFRSVRDDNALAYETGLLMSGGYLFPGELLFYALTGPGSVERAESLILQEVSRLHETGLTQEEFRKAQACAVFEMLTKADQPGEELADLLLMSICGRPVTELAALPDAVRGLDCETVNQILARKLEPMRRVCVRAGRF